MDMEEEARHWLGHQVRGGRVVHYNDVVVVETRKMDHKMMMMKQLSNPIQLEVVGLLEGGI